MTVLSPMATFQDPVKPLSVPGCWAYPGEETHSQTMLRGQLSDSAHCVLNNPLYRTSPSTKSLVAAGGRKVPSSETQSAAKRITVDSPSQLLSSADFRRLIG